MSDNIIGFFIVYKPNDNKTFDAYVFNNNENIPTASKAAKEKYAEDSQSYAVGLFIRYMTDNGDDDHYEVFKIPPKNPVYDKDEYSKFFKETIVNDIVKILNANKPVVFENPDGNLKIGIPSNRGGAKNKLENLTVKELQQRCIKRKIKYSGLLKADLIKALRK